MVDEPNLSCRKQADPENLNNLVRGRSRSEP
jgi:hypothetical protein